MKCLSRTLRSILKSLNLLDRFKPNLFDREVRSSDWNFEFQGARMFLIVFSPLYDHESSRETYGEKATFIMLQPQRLIWNKVLRDDEKIEQEKKEKHSVLVEIFSRRFANIRQRFADNRTTVQYRKRLSRPPIHQATQIGRSRNRMVEG
jgi:hypothetical protein